MRSPTVSRLALGLGGVSLLLGVGAAWPHLPSPLARAAGAPASDSPFPPPPDTSTADDLPPPPLRTVLLPTDPSLPRGSDGRHYPLIPRDPAALASLLVSVEEAVRAEGTPAADLPTLGHQQQVIYRVLSHREDLSASVRALLPERWRRVADLHLKARRAFLAMHRGQKRSSTLPAWRIISPEPPANLLRYYRKASEATGIDWEVLAAINLVETGMGRIDGISVANAHGPMQFLPTTWAEPGIGRGDIRDPHDAIQAAARYLVRRGGLQDIRRGLWGYNNSDHYGTAVLAYAELLREDPRAFTGLYHWEIHFASAAGDLWLPVGYHQEQPLPVSDWLRLHPASAPPPRPTGTAAAAAAGWAPEPPAP
jgi:hypothetical protein